MILKKHDSRNITITNIARNFIPSHISHVVSVKEQERSEYSGDADMVLLPDDNCHGLHQHHKQHHSLYLHKVLLIIAHTTGIFSTYLFLC